MNKDIARIETEIMQLNSKLEKLRRENPPTPVKNYTFEGPHGSVELLKLFGSKNKLILIHNMGQGCRWCTSWADGINAMLPHLENSFSVALVSKDPPELQRQFALARGWRFQMLSHGGGSYINEQGVVEGGKNDPGTKSFARTQRSLGRVIASIRSSTS